MSHLSRPCGGSGLVQVSNNLVASRPRWLSPNRIAFENVVAGDNTEIFAMNSDGTALVNLSNDPAVDRGINVELETGRIAFVREQLDKEVQDIWVMNSDGSGAQRHRCARASSSIGSVAPDLGTNFILQGSLDIRLGRFTALDAGNQWR